MAMYRVLTISRPVTLEDAERTMQGLNLLMLGAPAGSWLAGSWLACVAMPLEKDPGPGLDAALEDAVRALASVVRDNAEGR